MRRVLVALIVGVGFLHIYLGVASIRMEERLSSQPPDLFYLPPSKVLQMVHLDYAEFLADLIWVQTVLYFSEEFVGNRSFEHLEVLLNTVTDLDPRFEKAYIWGGSAFMYNGRLITKESIERSTRILKKGWSFYNESPQPWRIGADFWRIPFMIGFNYAIELKEKNKGAPYIRAAAKFEGVPDYIRTWGATLYRRAGRSEEALDTLKEQLALEMLRGHLRLAQDEKTKDQIIGQMRLIYRRAGTLKNATDMLRLEQRIERFLRQKKVHFGYLPLHVYTFIADSDRQRFRQLATYGAALERSYHLDTGDHKTHRMD